MDFMTSVSTGFIVFGLVFALLIVIYVLLKISTAAIKAAESKAKK